jgi:hypothetical protein
MAIEAETLPIQINEGKERKEGKNEKSHLAKSIGSLLKYGCILGNGLAFNITAFVINGKISTPYPWLDILYHATPIYTGFVSTARATKLMIESYQASWSTDKKKILILLPISLLTSLPNAVITWHEYNGNQAAKISLGFTVAVSSTLVNSYALHEGLKMMRFLYTTDRNRVKVKFNILDTIKKLKYKLLRHNNLNKKTEQLLINLDPNTLSLSQLSEILAEIPVDHRSAQLNIAALLLAAILATGGYPFMCTTKVGIQSLPDSLAWIIISAAYMPTTLLSINWVYTLLDAIPYLSSSYAWQRLPYITGLLYLLFISPALFSYRASVELTKQHINPPWQLVMEIVSSCGGVFFNASSLPFLIEEMVLGIGGYGRCVSEKNKRLAEICSKLEEVSEVIEEKPDEVLMEELSGLEEIERQRVLGFEAAELHNKDPKPGLMRRCYNLGLGLFTRCRGRKRSDEVIDVPRVNESSPLLNS